MKKRLAELEQRMAELEEKLAACQTDRRIASRCAASLALSVFVRLRRSPAHAAADRSSPRAPAAPEFLTRYDFHLSIAG